MLVVEVDEVVDVVEVVVLDVVVAVVVLTAIQVSFFSFNFPSLHLTSVIDASLKYFALIILAIDMLYYVIFCMSYLSSNPG